MTNTKYLLRQDKVCARLRYSVCKAIVVETIDIWYTHTHKPVCEHDGVTVLWNQGVHSDRQITANRPDIIIKSKKEKTCILLDVVESVDRNVTQKEAENIIK